MVQDYFEDFSVLMDAKINDEFSHFGENEITIESLGMGVAKTVICESMDTRITTTDKKTEDHLQRIKKHLNDLDKSLSESFVKSSAYIDVTIGGKN